MSAVIDLAPDYLAIVENILAEHVPEFEVRAFGSRATWTARDYSDLDLTVVADGPLHWQTISRLKESFEESRLPMRVDVVDWHSIPNGFREEIRRDYVVVQKGTRPDGWDKVTLGGFAPLKYGRSLPAVKRDSSGLIPVYGSNGIIGHHSTALTERPTVIIGRKGTVGAIHYSPVPCWPIDTTFYITGTDPEKMRFKYFAFKALDLAGMNSDSAVPGLNRNSAHAREMMVPEEVEQRRIARVLGTLDDKIALNRRMCETLEEMARALFRSWFVDFDPVRAKIEGRWRPGESLPGLPAELYDHFPDRLVPSNLSPIPEGWQVRTLEDLIILAYGKGLPARKRRPGAIRVYGSNGQIGWHNQKLVDGPGIVIGRKGNPGFVRWAPTDFYPIDTTFYVKVRNNAVTLPFLRYVLEEQELPSIAADSAVPGLNRNLAYMNKLVVPPYPLIRGFTAYISCVLERCRQLDEESSELTALRDALLPKLISGELRVGQAKALVA